MLKFTKRSVWATRILAIAVSLTPLISPLTQAQSSASPQSTLIKIEGSSTVQPITEAIAKVYQGSKAGLDTKITVNASGTSAGFKKFCAGEIQISDASRPILKAEMEACRKQGVAYIELPVAFDALTVVVNPQNAWATEITTAELQKIWEPAAQGKITTWNQVRPSWPKRPLKLFAPDSESGTFDYFTEAIVGKKGSSRKDVVTQADHSLIAQGVSKDPNALGYLGYAFYEKNQGQLKALAIDSGIGAVLPSQKAVERNQYQPLARPLFIYVNARDAQVNSDLRRFVAFYLKEAADVVKQVGYIPLPQESYHVAGLHLIRGKVGTVFEGKQQQNLTIYELLRKRATF